MGFRDINEGNKPGTYRKAWVKVGDKFSVLISVYSKENPEYLKQALESVINQTLMPSEIVVIEDGTIPLELEEVILSFLNQYPDIFNIIRFEKNRGLDKVLADGIKLCKYNIIARMDSDDISRSDRFEKQIKFLKEHPDIDVVGSWVSEFDTNPDNIYAQRQVPLEHEKIYKFAQFRCPMNHPSVMYKKEAVINADNYHNWGVVTGDYELWGRMLNKGYKFANIPENLVNLRAGKNMLKRRIGLKYIFYEYKIMYSFLKSGFINEFEFIRNVTLKFLLRIIPDFFRQFIYNRYLRKKVETH